MAASFLLSSLIFCFRLLPSLFPFVLFHVFVFKIAILHSDIANALEGSSEYDKAEEFISTAIAISDRYSDTDPQGVAMLFMNLGAIRNNRGVFDTFSTHVFTCTSVCLLEC